MVSATRELLETLNFSIGLTDLWMHFVYLLTLVGIIVSHVSGYGLVGHTFTAFLIGTMFGRITAISGE